MNYSEAKNLTKGDEVFWNDPDGGECSRVYKIESITIYFHDLLAVITEEDESVLTCFLSELSPVNEHNSSNS